MRRANLITLSVSLLVSLVLLEAGARVYLFGPESLNPTIMKSIRPAAVAGLIQRSSFPEIIYELKPNQDTFNRKKRFITNSHGLRDKEYPLEKPEGVYRVAVVGDSLTMGAGLAIEEVYHSLLEEQLGFEFINFGVGGYSLRQYVGVIKNKVLKYDPDLIMIGFFRNDSRVVKDADYNKPYQVKKEINPFWQSHFLISVQREIKLLRKPPKKRKVTPEDYEYVEKMLTALSKIETPIMIAYLDYKRGDRRFIDYLGETAKKKGMDFVDVSTAFKGDRSRFYVYRADHHPNAEANQIFARIIADKFTQRKNS